MIRLTMLANTVINGSQPAILLSSGHVYPVHLHTAASHTGPTHKEARFLFFQTAELMQAELAL